MVYWSGLPKQNDIFHVLESTEKYKYILKNKDMKQNGLQVNGIVQWWRNAQVGALLAEAFVYFLQRWLVWFHSQPVKPKDGPLWEDKSGLKTVSNTQSSFTQTVTAVLHHMDVEFVEAVESDPECVLLEES